MVRIISVLNTTVVNILIKIHLTVYTRLLYLPLIYKIVKFATNKICHFAIQAEAHFDMYSDLSNCLCESFALTMKADV